MAKKKAKKTPEVKAYELAVGVYEAAYNESREQFEIFSQVKDEYKRASSAWETASAMEKAAFRVVEALEEIAYP